jgi:hypothetical protein
MAAAVALAPAELAARKFFPDDPLPRDPTPLPARKAARRNINEYYDFFQNTFFEPGKQQRKMGDIPPARAVNTLGEVPDSSWFQNRIGSRPMTPAELLRGPGDAHAPSADGAWTVLSGKGEGVTPGLVIEDGNKRRYLIKFDPKSNPGMASACDVVGSKFFWALGYNVPENYIVTFTRDRLRLAEKSTYRSPQGHRRRMEARDIEEVLRKVPRTREGQYRAMASLIVPGDIIGPFRYYGTRNDDPNDVVPHEDRRDLRGLYVFAGWLNHTDSKSLNSLDSIVEERGLRFVRHYLIDFGAILGSDSFEPKSPRAGNVYLFDFKPAAWQFLSLGLYVPRWMRADYPDIGEAGRFDYETFDPERWKNNYPNPAFDRRLPDDTFWAARKVMAFTDDDIRRIVATGQYSDPRAAAWIARCLIARRDKIGRAFFDDVLPLDNFRVEEGRLRFDDLGVKYGLTPSGNYSVQWFVFDNEREVKTAIAGRAGFEVPRERSPYLAADIRGADAAKVVSVYLETSQGRPRVVGVERRW